MAPDEIAVLAVVVLFTVGGFALAYFATRKNKNNASQNKDE